MDLETVIQSEGSWTEKEKYCMISLYAEFTPPKKYKFTKQKQTHRLREQIYSYLGEEG